MRQHGEDAANPRLTAGALSISAPHLRDAVLRVRPITSRSRGRRADDRGRNGEPPHATEGNASTTDQTPTPRESPAAETTARLARRAGGVLEDSLAADSGPPDRSQRRTAAPAAPGHFQWRPVCAADRMPVEDDAAGIQFGFVRPPPLPGVGPLRRIPRVVAALLAAIR